jgi:hypothetical protein
MLCVQPGNNISIFLLEKPKRPSPDMAICLGLEVFRFFLTQDLSGNWALWKEAFSVWQGRFVQRDPEGRREGVSRPQVL